MSDASLRRDDDALDSDAWRHKKPDPATVEALAEHRRAMGAWLNSSMAQRAAHWFDLETAWRRVRALGVADQAQRNAATLAIIHGKLRSTR